MSSGGKAGGHPTVGYWYYMDVHFVLSNGPVESIEEIRCGDRVITNASFVSSQSIPVNRPDLFGGEKREGGLVGVIDYMDGSDDQVVNPGLADSLNQALGVTVVPAFRGLCSFFFRGVRLGDYSGTPWESGQAAFPSYSTGLDSIWKIAYTTVKDSFAWSAMNPYFKAPSFKVKNRTVAGWYPAKAAIGDQMNPAHIIYAVIAGSNWVGGLGGAVINEASFTAAADVMYDEGLGLGFKWDSAATRREFINTVANHMQGNVGVNIETGEWEINLIRDDYVVGDLIEMNPDNCNVIEESRRGLSETVNEVIVTYTRPDNGDKDTVSVSDTANRALQGKTVTQEVEYLGCHSAELATKLAYRDLRVLSQPLSKVTIETDRTAAQLPPGTPFVLVYPALGIESAVYRVVKRDLGALTSGKITLECIEDVFTSATISTSSPQASLWSSPASEPQDITNVYLTEAPYYLLNRATTQAERDEWVADVGFTQVFAQAPDADSSVFEMRDTDTGDSVDNADFVATAVLSSDIGFDTSVIGFSNPSAFFAVGSPILAYVDDEMVQVTAIDFDTGQVTVDRAVFDTTPAQHSAGAVIYFMDGDEDGGFDPTQRVSGETAHYKFLTNTSLGILALADATPHSITLDNRYLRPYAPGNFALNGSRYPDYIEGAVTASWAHRDRVSQEDVVVLQTDGPVGPEAGVTYNLSIYGEAGDLLRTETGLSTASFSYAAADELTDSLLFSGETPVGDYLWASVVSLLHFEGSAGSTTFTDETGITWTVSGTGTREISTAEFMLGASSGYFTGGGYISAADSSDWAFGTGDFTVEFFMNLDSLGSGGYWDAPVGNWASSVGWCVFVKPTGDLDVHLNNTALSTGTGVISAGTWYHIAVVRQSGVVRMFVDGVKVKEGAVTQDLTAVTGIRVGDNTSPTDTFEGYIDELRITKGSCRYRSDFTPPTGPYDSFTGPSPYRYNSQLRVVLESERSGLASWQAHDYTVDRAGYGLNYGLYYGGGV